MSCRIFNHWSGLQSGKDRPHEIVTTNGCFDILHYGHLEALDFILRHSGDRPLYVLVNSDTMAARKSPIRPIVTQWVRMMTLAAVPGVSLVVSFDEPDPSLALDYLMPTIHWKGVDWAEKPCPERQIVETNGGIMKFHPVNMAISTSHIIEDWKHRCIR